MDLIAVVARNRHFSWQAACPAEPDLFSIDHYAWDAKRMSLRPAACELANRFQPPPCIAESR